MSTYIIVGVCICFTLALSAKGIFHKRKLHGTTSKEWLGHQYDYDPGFSLLFKRLPEICLFGKLRLGSLGSLLVFIVLVPYVLGLLASVADKTLFLSGEAISFFKDYMTLLALVAIAVTFYLFRNAMHMVPKALCSIPNDTSGDLSQAQFATKIEICLKKAASILFQTEEGRGRWGRVLDVGLIIVFAGWVAFAWVNDVNNPPKPGKWNHPEHFWGNMLGIIEYSLAFAYVVPRGLGYLIRLVCCVWYLGKKLNEESLFRIQPLDPDGAGGFGKFGGLAWRIDLTLLPALIIAYLSLLQGVNPVFIIGVILTILLIPVFFFGPLWGLHKAMDRAKSKELVFLSLQYNLNSSIIRRWLNGEEGVKRTDMLSAKQDLENVILLHERTSRMPVWPFDHTMLTRVLGYFLFTITAIVLQKVFQVN